MEALKKALFVGQDDSWPYIIPVLLFSIFYYLNIFSVLQDTGMYAEIYTCEEVKNELISYANTIEELENIYPIMTLKKFEDGSAEKSMTVRAYNKNSQRNRPLRKLLLFPVIGILVTFWVGAIVIYHRDNKHSTMLRIFNIINVAGILILMVYFLGYMIIFELLLGI